MLCADLLKQTKIIITYLYNLNSTAHPDGGTGHNPEMMLASFSEDLKEIKFMMINIFEGHTLMKFSI